VTDWVRQNRGDGRQPSFEPAWCCRKSVAVAHSFQELPAFESDQPGTLYGFVRVFNASAHPSDTYDAVVEDMHDVIGQPINVGQPQLFNLPPLAFGHPTILAASNTFVGNEHDAN